MFTGINKCFPEQAGEWYSISVTVTKQRVDVTLNNNKKDSSQLMLPGSEFIPKQRVYIGGVPRHLLHLLSTMSKTTDGFIGLIFSVHLPQQTVHFKDVMVIKSGGHLEGFFISGPSEFSCFIVTSVVWYREMS